MNESFVTVCGNVVADPQARSTKTGKPFASFRVASTTRRWDAEARGFVDGSTNFVNVVGFNALGANVMNSLKRGEPVVVYGRLRVNQYLAADGKHMTSVEVDAHGVGHDLTRGSSVFNRTSRPQFEPHDRLADPHILASFDEVEVLDELAGDPSGDHEGTVLPPPPEPASGVLREEDADTDPYVVTAH
ncbi:MAG: single-stranded DNA-binding protein [Actinomycetota bacterium]|nr:single-stranded DNA-binding protein [Actinomycetota bacterium]